MVKKLGEGMWGSVPCHKNIDRRIEQDLIFGAIIQPDSIEKTASIWSEWAFVRSCHVAVLQL